MKAKTTFLINREVWSEGESKVLGVNQAKELLHAGLVEEVAETNQLVSATPKKPRKTAEKRETKPTSLSLETK